MELKLLNCPNCGAPLPEDFTPNRRLECANCHSALLVTDLVESQAVVCPQCNTINDQQKRYCANCGQPLKIDCILCHTENKVGATHCRNCGAHLEAARARRSSLQEARQRHRLEFVKRFKEKEARQKAEKLQQLLDALDEPENHDMAIFQLNQMGAEAIDPLIDTLLNDDDPDARYGSARALGQICHQHSVKALIKARAARALITALQDSHPAVRYWSVDALGRCKSQTAVEPLAGLLQDPHEGVRERAKGALQLIGGERARQILAQTEPPKGLLGWIKGQ